MWLDPHTRPGPSPGQPPLGGGHTRAEIHRTRPKSPAEGSPGHTSPGAGEKTQSDAISRRHDNGQSNPAAHVVSESEEDFGISVVIVLLSLYSVSLNCTDSSCSGIGLLEQVVQHYNIFLSPISSDGPLPHL